MIFSQIYLYLLQNATDIETLNEAHGILGDILFQESELSKKGKESLKRIQEILAPRVSRTASLNPVRSRINSGVSDDESDASSSIGVSPHIYGYRTSKSHRKSVLNQFTTTTTATGLPTLNPNPSERKRSLAPRDIRSRISLVEGVQSSHFRGRLGSLQSPLSMRYKNSVTSSPQYSSQVSDASDVEPSSDVSTRQPVAAISGDISLSSISETPPTAPSSVNEADKRKSSTRRSGVSLTNLGPIKLDIEEIDGDTTEAEVATPFLPQTMTIAKGGVNLFNHLITPPMDYSLDDYQQNNIELLDQVMEWDFPIFEMEKVAGDHILSQMAYCLFLEAGLIDTFEIPQKQFLNYFRMLEANYGPSTYHNKTHAADVLHATSYLLFEQIPEFSHEISRSSEREWQGHQRKSLGGSIASALSILEVFACYMAAAMHDFDHPGRTNAFLVATKNPLAILYNDKSVLENHHAAASWHLLTTMPENNFLMQLEEAELKRFRFLLIECILATDLKLHFDIVRSFKEKAKEEIGIDWTDDVERLQVMKMVIKMADINTATKSFDLHRAWTVRITEEFYQQHDDENKMNLPKTIFMSREEKEKLPAIQVSFIQNLVAPLFHVCAESGIIPGMLIDENEKQKDNEDEEDIDEDDVSIDEASSEVVTHKVVSIILTNLEMNFEAWKSELPPPSPKNEKDDNDDDN
jgi:hypothetical protein